MSSTATFAQLQQMLSDLDGYIDRKAQEIAGEKASDAVHNLLVRISAAESEVAMERERCEDLRREFRHREETRARMEKWACERLAAALGRAGRCTLNLSALVGEVEAALASKKTPAREA